MAVVRNMHRLCGSRIQGFGFTEDWGTETDLQISPELWRRFFFPRYQRLFDAIHECGWHVHMHSCGKINKALPGLIEAGLDVINMQQPRTNGIDEIGRQFAGRICFETLCDIQKTLPGGNRAEIEAEARRLLHAWGTPVGRLHPRRLRRRSGHRRSPRRPRVHDGDLPPPGPLSRQLTGPTAYR